MIEKINSTSKRGKNYLVGNLNRHPQVVKDCLTAIDPCWAVARVGYVFNKAQLNEVLDAKGYSKQAIKAVNMILISTNTYEDDLLSIAYRDNYRFDIKSVYE